MADAPLLDWLQQLHEPCVASDAEGQILWCNAAFAAATGLDRPGDDLRRLQPESTAGRAVFEHALQGIAPPDCELALRAVDGRALRLCLRTLRFGAGRVLWNLRDLGTDREPAPQRQPQPDASAPADIHAHLLTSTLTRINAQLRLAVELGNITVWRHDLKTDLIYVDGSGPSIMGLQSSTGEGVPIARLYSHVHPDDLPRVKASTDHALRTRLPSDNEARYRQRDGSWRHVLTRRVVQRAVDGTALALVGVSLDVTERVVQERQATELVRQLDIATTAAGVGLWNRVMGSEQPLWNAQMYRLLGRPRSLGPANHDEWLHHIVHPDDRAMMSRARESLLGSESGMQESEYRITQPDGEVRWLTHRTSIEAWEGHSTVFGVVLDVTDRKNAELARQQKALAERESLAKSEFLARISHELRTPLNAVLGFTQLLQLDNGRLDAASRQVQLAHIRSAGEHLLALINDVLDLTSLQSGQPHLELQAVDWGELVAEALPMLASLAQQLRVELDNTPLSGVVRADRVRLRQVLINLVSNAIKYNRPGGRVTLQTCILDGAVELQVHDTGRGLTDEQVRHLFEPFNRLGIEPEGIEGSGIGLVIVKALVDAMHGTVDVHSQPGVGTVFTLTLPRATEPAPAVTPPTPPVAVARRERRGSVLYIEDNAINVMLVEELVRSLPGLLIASETTGEAGLAHVRAHHPDLVLIDMQLPDMNGVDVLRALRDSPETAATRCIALSANAMPSDIAQARQAGFDDYWTKPIDVVQFMDALETLFPTADDHRP